jgi:hypothetical protein
LLCSLCGHNNAPDNRFCGMCGMPLENAVFQPPPDAIPPASSLDPESDADADFDDASSQAILNTVPPLWDRVPPTPESLDEPALPTVRREVPAESPVAAPAVGSPAAAPRDEVRERLSTMAENRSRASSSTSILGLDSSDAGNESEYYSAPSSISGPSFLGLDSGGSGSADYLLDDEESAHGRAWLVTLVIIMLAALVGLQWRTEVQNQARRVASVVKARLQQPNAKTNATSEEAAPSSSEAKNSPAETARTPGTATPPQPEAAKTIGDDQNPVKPATPEQPSPAPPAESDKPAVSRGKTPATAEADPAKSEKAAVAKEEPPADVKHSPAPEEEAAPKEEATASKRSAGKLTPMSATREPAPQPTVDDSMLMKAQKYFQGQGVPRSCEQGMVYLRQAVRQPSPRARSQMGALYATGTCVPQNRVEAYRWFSSALDLDPRNPWLARERDMLYSEMTSAERQRVTP